jgi:hypothetical protein
MMDFVVSKVAMSVCALLTMLVLTQAYGPGAFADEQGDLERILAEFCSTASAPVLAGTECALGWTVPCLPDGGTTWITLERGTVSVSSESGSVWGRPGVAIHTWHWNGSVLNDTAVSGLDSGAETISACSGQVLVVCSAAVEFDDGTRLLAFVRGGT